MTENKRFVAIGVEWVDGFIQDHIGDRDLFNIGVVCNLLNELSEENEQLKKQIGNLEHTKNFCAECCERLEKENEELKSEIRKVQMEYEQLWMHTYK